MWAAVTWERVTSISTLRAGGTFIMGYEGTANSGVIIPLRTDATNATTTANGYLYSGTGLGTTSDDGTINMSSVTETAKYELYITASSVSNAINMQLADNNGNYIGCPNSKNTARLYTAASANTAYTLSVGTNNVFTLECKAADTGSKYKYLKFNNNSSAYRFANYSSTPDKIVFYKKVTTYQLTYSASNGSIAGVDAGSNAVASGASVEVGATVTLTATPASGYLFASWNVSGTNSELSSTSSNPTTFTMGTANATVTANFVSASVCAAPAFSIAGGTYNAVQSVELSSATDGVTIYYTTNGTDPTASSSVYTSPITVTETTTIKAFAVKDGLTDSDIASATYTLKCIAPTISIPNGIFVSSKVLTMTSSTEGTTIYYTTDGSTIPTSSSTAYDSSNKPSISATTTIMAIATKNGWSDSDVATETFTKETVLDGISALNAATTSSTATAHYVKLTDAQITFVDANNNGFLNDANAGIYLFALNDLALNTKYNGVYKITSKTYYNWPEVTKFETIAGEGSSEVASEMAPVEMTASALEENFSDNLSRQIRIKNHTLTGSKLTSGIDIPNAFQGGSLTDDGTYTLIGYPSIYNSTKKFNVVTAYPKPQAPTFVPVEGEFSNAFTLHLACATDGVAIYYTTNGTDPTTSSTLYNDATGINIPAANTTVKAIAYYQDMTSDVASATYTYKAVAKPLFGTASGTDVYYGTKITVTCATDGVNLYYTMTTDGNDPADPTNASTPYPDGGIAVNANTVKIKVVAEKNGDYSSIASATYTLKDPAAPIFSVEAGAVARNTIVTISSAEGTTIYYTTDGSDADTGTDAGSNSVNVTITDAMTLKAIAVDPELNMSTEASAAYTIAQVATPVISTAAGMLSKGTQVTITTATDGATIYYTLDGTDPTVSSNVYTSYVVINKACTLKAIAFKENYIDSEVASVTYTVAGDNEAIVFKDLGLSNEANLSTINGTDITLTFAKGTASNDPKYYTSDNTARLYSGGSLTVSSTKDIIRIEYSINSGFSLDGSSSGTLSSGVWTGNATSVKVNATGNCRFKSITVYFDLTDDNVTVGSSKLAGFCSEYKLDFSGTGLSAYKAKVSGNKVVLTKIADGIVPANMGVILNGDADDYDLPITTADATTDFSDNEMVGVTQRTQVLWSPSTGVYNYILQSGEFKKASNGYLKPNRAYLSTSYNVSATSARDYLEISFEDDDVTGVENINREAITSDQFFDLQGRKVEQPQKGLYIVNGKKVIIK